VLRDDGCDLLELSGSLCLHEAAPPVTVPDRREYAIPLTHS
jgi:hypothetical protein